MHDIARKDWNFDVDGKLVGRYVETRRVNIKSGPSAGQAKPVVDFHVDPDDDLVSVWPGAVLRRMLGDELRLRGKGDFEDGEQMEIKPLGKKEGKNGPYADFEDVVFEFAAEKPSAADLLGAGTVETEGGADDDIAF